MAKEVGVEVATTLKAAWLQTSFSQTKNSTVLSCAYQGGGKGGGGGCRLM